MLSAALSALVLPVHSADAEATIRLVREKYAAYADAERHLGKARLAEAATTLRREIEARDTRAIDAYLAVFEDPGLRRIAYMSDAMRRRSMFRMDSTLNSSIVRENEPPKVIEVDDFTVPSLPRALSPDDRREILGLRGRTRFLLDLRTAWYEREPTERLLPYLTDGRTMVEYGWESHRSAPRRARNGRRFRIAPAKGIVRVAILTDARTAGEAERLVALVSGSTRVRTFGMRTSGGIDTWEPQEFTTPTGWSLQIPSIRSRRMATLTEVGTGIRPDEEGEPEGGYDWPLFRANQWLRGLD